jgi:hypothetical protein
MHGFYIERRKLPIGISLSKDLVQHIFTRAAHGPVVVIAERPQDLAAVTKKQWNALIRLVQRERASTLRAARIAELSNQVKWMQQLVFTAKTTDELFDNCTLFMGLAEALHKPPICSTLYITSKLTAEQFHLATSWLPRNSVVVAYEKN